MSNLENLTRQYNDVAEANGFLRRDKRFRSYETAMEELTQIKEAAKKKKQRAVEAEENAIQNAIDELGWSDVLVRSLTWYERTSAMSLMRKVLNYEEKLGKFLNEAESDLAYAIKWAEDSVKLSHKAKLSKEILDGFEKQAEGENPVTFQEWVSKIRESLKDKMLSDYFRGGSTSALSNAVEGAQRAAVADMVGSFGALAWVDYKDE